jgi:hypothetical protein
MEPISNLPPSVPSKELSSIAGQAFASFSNEVAKLIAMTKDEKLPVSNLGNKIDVKV